MKKLMVAALVLFLVTTSVFAERLYDYRGVFPADRGDDARITNYILLKKGSRIRFEIEEQGHGATDKVKVAKVQLTSVPSVSFADAFGIKNLDLSETGIYEITLVPATGLAGELRFVLKVIETSDEPPVSDQPAAVRPADDIAQAIIIASPSAPVSNATSSLAVPPVTITASPAAFVAPASSAQVVFSGETAVGSATILPQPDVAVIASAATATETSSTDPVLTAPAAGYFVNPFVGFKFVADSLNMMPESNWQKYIRVFVSLADGSQSTVSGSFFSPEPDVVMFLPQAVMPGAIYHVEIFDRAGNKVNSHQVAAMPELAVDFKSVENDVLISVSWKPQSQLLANPAGQMLALNNCDVIVNADGGKILQLNSEQTRQPFGSLDQINWRARPYALEMEIPLSLIASECSVEVFAAIDGTEQKTSAYRASWQKTASATGATSDFSDVEASDDLIYEKPKEEFSIQPFTARDQLPDTSGFAIEKSFLLVDNEADSLLAWPQDVVWDENGSLWILDSQLRRISNYNVAGQMRTSFGSRGDAQGNLGLPVALAQKNSTLFVSDTARHAIHKFTNDGLFVVSIFSESDTGVVIDLPGGVCFRKEEMWVADRGTARILCFNQQGGFLGSFGSTNSAPIEAPVSVKADQDSLFILEKSGLVKKFSPMGQFDATFQSGSSDGSGLEVDRWGGVWVCDAGQLRVMRFSRKGAVLAELKAPPAAKPWLPTSVAVRSDGKVVVTDAANKMLHVFTPTE